MGHGISEADMAAYRAGAARRRAERDAAIEARRKSALDLAHRAAERLKVEFGATAVVLFGSTVSVERFHLRSDVDLVAWGVAEERFLRAVSALLSLDPSLSVDLVRAESAPP
ncbi:MAG: nucleotidyltransferase domain-containing protein, partial [Deferrisomatales bacterium]